MVGNNNSKFVGIFLWSLTVLVLSASVSSGAAWNSSPSLGGNKDLKDPCTDDAGCSPGEKCFKGSCVSEDDLCSSDSDCQEDESCTGGLCIPEPFDCSVCFSNETCTEDSCIPNDDDGGWKCCSDWEWAIIVGAPVAAIVIVVLSWLMCRVRPCAACMRKDPQQFTTAATTSSHAARGFPPSDHQERYSAPPGHQGSGDYPQKSASSGIQAQNIRSAAPPYVQNPGVRSPQDGGRINSSYKH